MLNTVTISDTYIDEIMSIAGHPLLTLDDGDFELTEDQVKTFVVVPSIREYYRWFPIKNIQEYTISASFEIAFPNSDTFDIVHANYNSAGDLSTPLNGNAVINARYWTKDALYGPNMYCTGNSYGMENAQVLRNSLNQSYIDKYKAFRIYTDLSERKLKGYTNSPGKLSVIWAEYSSDFDDIPFNRLNDMIQLCQAKLLEQLAMIRGQANADIPNEFNVSLFEDKAADLREEVMNKWRKISKIAIQKG